MPQYWGIIDLLLIDITFFLLKLRPSNFVGVKFNTCSIELSRGLASLLVLVTLGRGVAFFDFFTY